MKLLFWTLMFLSGIISNGYSAAVDVMRPPADLIRSPSDTIDAAAIEKFKREALASIEVGYGPEVCRIAREAIQRISKDQISIPLLQAIFDSVTRSYTVGEKSPRSATVPAPSNLQRLENILKEKNISTNLEFNEFVKGLDIEKIDSAFWNGAMVTLSKQINSGDNTAKLKAAKLGVEMAVKLYEQQISTRDKR